MTAGRALDPAALPRTAEVAGAGRLVVATVDYHAAGEPFRIVTGGVAPVPGRTMLEKRRHAAQRLDHVRRLLVFEPRGHADMYGGLLVEPCSPGGDLGVLFFHNAGWSTACGHGTIALATAALETGLLPAAEPETRLRLDVPSGTLDVAARVEEGRVRSVRFRNVPSFVAAERVRVETARGPLEVDVAFGGAFYAVVDAAAAGLDVTPESLEALVALGREVKRRVDAAGPPVHPEEPELRGVYGVVFFRREGRDGAGRLRQRNVTVFADGEVDRSPCGSGTSARLALLDARGELRRGETLVHGSVVGTEFEGRVVGEAAVGGRPAIVTEVEGSAHLTGFHRFVLERDDPLGAGFLLR